MRRKHSVRGSLLAAMGQGLHAGQQNFQVMAVLLAVMGLIVAGYYYWPAMTAFLARYAAWQNSGGIFTNALASGLGGGVLSEISLVYIRDRGRWNRTHLHHMLFKFCVFLAGGALVTEFYRWQTYWFGNGATWQVIAPKVLVDQFVYAPFWGTPFLSIMFRWQHYHYSFRPVWRELNLDFFIERMMPINVTSWMFWIPGVSLVYAMPLDLQMPLCVFATAIWAVLASSVAHRKDVAGEPVPEDVEVGPGALANPAD